MGRDISLKKSKLNKWRYRELKYFCLQYPDWKKQLKENTTIIKAVEMSGLPKGNGINNKVEKIVLKRIALEEKCKKVEQSAIEADATIYQAILKNVTQNIPYEYINVPCGRKQFYEARINFFNILDKKR